MIQILENRSKIINLIRQFFVDNGFLEVETPLLVKYPGMEPYLNPFKTEVVDESGNKHDGYLITSPEYTMKKILAAGAPKIFNITKCFRNNEPFGGSHNPEFTMIEWYQADADYRDVMVDTEKLVSYVAMKFGGSNIVKYGESTIDFTAPWPRFSLKELFAKYVNIDLDLAIIDLAYFQAQAKRLEVNIAESDNFDDIFFRIFLRDIEPKVSFWKEGEYLRPVIVYDYPRSMAALAKIKTENPLYAERFEAYCAGLELGNAFSELNNSTDQRARLVEEQQFRQSLSKEVFGLDADFLEAVSAMPQAGGIAFGVDRLVMLLTNAQSIEEVLPFSASKLFK